MAQTIQRMERRVLKSLPRRSKAAKAALSKLHHSLLRVADRLLDQEIDFFPHQAIRLAAIIMSKQGHERDAAPIFHKFDAQIDAEAKRLSGIPEDKDEVGHGIHYAARLLTTPNESANNTYEAFLVFKEEVASAILQAAGSLPLFGKTNGLYQRAVDELLAAADAGIPSYATIVVNCADLEDKEFPSLLSIIEDSYSSILLKYHDSLLPSTTTNTHDDAWEDTVAVIALSTNIILFFPTVPFLTESATAAIRHHYEIMKSIDHERAIRSLEEIEIAFRTRPEERGKEVGLSKALSLIEDLYGDDRPLRSAEQITGWKQIGLLRGWDQTQVIRPN